MPTVSLCMIAKDEESTLAAALESARGNVDEMIVVDTGSTDATPSIAAAYGAKVTHTVWNSNFAEARNKSISQARGDYILVLDADERLPLNAREKIEVFVSKYPNAFGRVRIRSPYVGEDGLQAYAMHHVTRFFPRAEGVQYVGKVHEQLEDIHGLRETHALDCTFQHVGYQDTQTLHEKNQRNLEILLSSQLDTPNKAYHTYQLAKTYQGIGDHKRALECFDASYVLGDPTSLYYPELIVSYLYELKRNHNFDTLWAVLARGLDLYPDLTDLYFLAGKAMIDAKIPDLHGIRQTFETCLLLGEKGTKYPSVEGTGTYLAAYNLGAYYEAAGDMQSALMMYRRSLQMGFAQAEQAVTRVTSAV